MHYGGPINTEFAAEWAAEPNNREIRVVPVEMQLQIVHLHLAIKYTRPRIAMQQAQYLSNCN